MTAGRAVTAIPPSPAISATPSTPRSCGWTSRRPPAPNCLAFGFRFLSEEFPENVGENVNDGFIAQLDTSGLDHGRGRLDHRAGQLRLRRHGRRGQHQHVRGRRRGGRRHHLRRRDAAAERRAGAHARRALALPVDLRPGRRRSSTRPPSSIASPSSTTAAGGCVRGAQADQTPPAVSLAVNPNNDAPVFSGAAGDAAGDSSTVTVNVYAGAAAAGTPVQTLATTRSGTAWQVAAATLPAGQYTARAEQADTAGNLGLSAPATFTAAAPQVVVVDPEPSTGARAPQERRRGPGVRHDPRQDQARQVPHGSARASRSRSAARSTRPRARCGSRRPRAPAAGRRARCSSRVRS